VDRPAPETPKKVYVRPELQKRERVDEVLWGQRILITTGKISV
jgi:hypothetical protein